MNHRLSMLGQTLKWPLRRLLSFPAVRRHISFELRQHYYDEMECRLPVGYGLVCPIQFWEAFSSLGHIFFDGEYARAFDGIAPPERWLDIGCYAGYFSLFVACQRQRIGLSGNGEALLVD